MIASLALVPIAYLVGTFPTAHLVGRAGGHDVLREGSGNPGASNVYRLMGRGPAVLVFAGDILKGALPAAMGLVLWDHAGAYALGIAAVVGHVYPATRRFRGGRGVATAGGLALVVYPLVTVGLVVAFFVVSALTRRASLASIVIAVALPLLVWARGASAAEVVLLAGLSVLVVARHLPNLRRLISGRELRVDRSGGRSSGAGDPGDPGETGGPGDPGEAGEASDPSVPGETGDPGETGGPRDPDGPGGAGGSGGTDGEPPAETGERGAA